MDDSRHQKEREIATGLVARIAGGDRSAEVEMVRRYSRGLLFLLRRQTRNKHLAEDLLQETWRLALEKIRSAGKPDEPARLAGYLSGIARNLASGERRRVERQGTSSNTEIVELAKDASASPFNQLSRTETRRHVRLMLKELSQDRDREILNRFYVREESKSRICKDLGLDDAHFNRVLFRARQRLKEIMLRVEVRRRFSVVR